MNKIKIVSFAISLPKNTVAFGENIRYRITGKETQLSLAVDACQKVLNSVNIPIEEIDCLVSAAAVGMQPIPCTAAIIHEQIAKNTSIPALDINTTCTSFVTSLDIMSYLIASDRYKKVLLVASDVASQALNPKHKESFELFSDGAVAFLLSQTEEDCGILAAEQQTWSQGAHCTEIRGGLSLYHPRYYTEQTKEEYMFSMSGKTILSLCLQKLPPMFDNFLKKYHIEKENIDFIVPHQASSAMELMMKKLRIPKTKYINITKEYGNMVSASIPIALAIALKTKKIKKGDCVLLLGTAAGLTTNMLLLKT